MMKRSGVCFWGPREGEDEPEEAAEVCMGAPESMTFVGKLVGGCCCCCALAKLCNGLAGLRLSEPEREKEAMAAAPGGGMVLACPLGVISSSLSSCMIWIAPALANPGLLGGGGGVCPSSTCTRNGECTLLGLFIGLCAAPGDSEPDDGLADAEISGVRLM